MILHFRGWLSQYAVINGLHGDDYRRITIFTFGGSFSADDHNFGGKSMHNSISRIEIDMERHSYTSRRLTNISCPTFGRSINANSNQHGHYMRVVFCEKSKTIHLFGQKFARHYSIKLKSLTNAQTIQN